MHSSAPPESVGGLKCPFCCGPMSVDVEVTTIQTYFIRDRIKVVEKDGTSGPPTFITSAPRPSTRGKVFKTVRCFDCGRTFYEAGRSIELDPVHLRVELEHFTEDLFQAMDVTSKPKEQFLLKSRPRETV